MTTTTSAIRLARVPARLSSRPGMRQALERWLANSDMTRHGFPPQAIVLLRRVDARWSQITATDAATSHQALGVALARAVRPACGARAGDVVWFADEAELLACMASDVLAGALPLRWWWRALLREQAHPVLAIAHWLRAARVVPRAMTRLSYPSARAWIAGWDARARAELLHGLSQAFPLASWVPVCVQRGILPPSLTPLRDASAGPPLTVDLRPTSIIGPEAELERLVRLCMALAADPSAACASRPAAPLALRLLGQTLLHLEDVHAGAGDEPEPRADLTRLTARARRPLDPQQAPDSSALPSEQTVPPALAPRALLSIGTDKSRPALLLAEPELRSRFAQPDAPAAPMPVPPTPLALPNSAFTTAHGGLFFLLNAALELGLYGDFSQPLQRVLPCCPFRFLLRAGLALCGPGFRADALAAWLAQRSPSPSPQTELASHTWAMPPAWLAPFAQSPGPWRVAWRGKWMRLQHPAGFVVIETVANESQADRVLAAEWARLGLEPPAVQRNDAAPARASAGSRHRLHRARPGDCPEALWPYLRARLALALGSDAREGRKLTRRLLRLPARIVDSGERVDVHLSLDELPVAVRLAGLDRDPGWLPAAGCDFRFHFTSH